MSNRVKLTATRETGFFSGGYITFKEEGKSECICVVDVAGKIKSFLICLGIFSKNNYIRCEFMGEDLWIERTSIQGKFSERHVIDLTTVNEEEAPLLLQEAIECARTYLYVVQHRDDKPVQGDFKQLIECEQKIKEIRSKDVRARTKAECAFQKSMNSYNRFSAPDEGSVEELSRGDLAKVIEKAALWEDAKKKRLELNLETEEALKREKREQERIRVAQERSALASQVASGEEI